MDANLTQYFLTQGPFAVLFVWLFWFSRKAAAREKKLYQTIDQNRTLKKFSEKYDIVINKLDGIEDRLPPRFLSKGIVQMQNNSTYIIKGEHLQVT
ncbi:hypothetical protein KQI21_09745 [Virgibacillus proomii]|nr:hypothetical protein [Virgibacillus proomii]